MGETWFLTLMEGHLLEVFESRVLTDNILTEERLNDRQMKKTA
jgi:hypothetical protein